METNLIPAWHYIWNLYLYWWLLSVAKVHNFPEISSYASGLRVKMGLGKPMK